MPSKRPNKSEPSVGAAAPKKPSPKAKSGALKPSPKAKVLPIKGSSKAAAGAALHHAGTKTTSTKSSPAAASAAAPPPGAKNKKRKRDETPDEDLHAPRPPSKKQTTAKNSSAKQNDPAGGSSSAAAAAGSSSSTSAKPKAPAASSFDLLAKFAYPEQNSLEAADEGDQDHADVVPPAPELLDAKSLEKHLRAQTTTLHTDWAFDLAILKNLRAERCSVVDYAGCDRLGDPLSENFAFQTLVSALLSSQTKDTDTAKAMVNLRQLDPAKGKGINKGLKPK